MFWRDSWGGCDVLSSELGRMTPSKISLSVGATEIWSCFLWNFSESDKFLSGKIPAISPQKRTLNKERIFPNNTFFSG